MVRHTAQNTPDSGGGASRRLHFLCLYEIFRRSILYFDIPHAGADKGNHPVVAGRSADGVTVDEGLPRADIEPAGPGRDRDRPWPGYGV